MQSRESIPNVGRRAQGRKALFMLKGSGVTSTLDQDSGHQRLRQPHDSLAICDDDGNMETPASYDESILSQPCHPYNRIIQHILHRHHMAQKKYQDKSPLTRTPRSDDRDGYGQLEGTSQHHATGSHKTASPDLQVDKTKLPRKHRNPLSPTEHKIDTGHMMTERDTYLKLPDDPEEGPQSCRMCRQDDRSVSALDRARGYLTGRSYPRDSSFVDGRAHSGVQNREESLLTTRSDCWDRLCDLPRVSRNRNISPLDDLLDYFWVYQGMSRQVLHPGVLADLRGQKVYKKPTSLPPICLATGHKVFSSTSITSSSKRNRTGSSSAEETDARSDAHQRPKRHTTSKPRRVAPSPRRSRGTSSSSGHDDQTDDTGNDANVSLSSVNDNTDTDCCDKKANGEGDENGRTRMRLIIKMPVLTQDNSCPDLLDND